MTEHGDNEFRRITPVTVRPGHRPQGPRRSAETRAPWLLAGLLLLAVLAAAGGAWLWLDGIEARAPAPARAAKSTPPKAKPTQPAPPPDADKRLAARAKAQKLKKRLAAKRKELDERAVKRWAAGADKALARAADTGARQFEARAYAAAAKTYGRAIAKADGLLASVDAVLADALTRGATALKSRDSQAAARAFELALAIAPDSAKAKRGAARAASLDRVLALMRRAQAKEKAGDLAGARAAYKKARRLDNAYEPARKAVDRIAATLAKRRFERHMAAGSAALTANDYAKARRAFTAARKIRPHAGGAADGLARAKAGLRRRAIAAHRGKAKKAAADQRWDDAVSQFDHILAIDPSLAFARRGKTRAQKRAQLDNDLADYLAHPARLGLARVRDRARASLAAARAVDTPGPRLQRRIARLSHRLAAASTPVAVRLRSDGKTHVAVYHVGRLGTFENKALKLTPGVYTAVGHRDGYRDVRRRFTVAAGDPVGPITIRCQDKL